MSGSEHLTSNAFYLTTDHESSDGRRPVLVVVVDGQKVAYPPNEYVRLPVVFAAGSHQRYLQASDLFTAGDLVVSCLRHSHKRGELPEEERGTIAAYFGQSPKYQELMRKALEGE